MTALLRATEFRFVPDLFVDFGDVSEGSKLRKDIETHQECVFNFSIQRSSILEGKLRKLAETIPNAPEQSFGFIHVDNRSMNADVQMALSNQQMDDFLKVISSFGAHQCQVEATLEVSDHVSDTHGGRFYLIVESPTLYVHSDIRQ